MKKFIVWTILFFPFYINAVAYTSYGMGTQSCGKWIEDRNSGNFYARGNWILGYISSYGYYGSDQLTETDSSAIFAFMDNFCREKPLSSVEKGAQALIKALKK